MQGNYFSGHNASFALGLGMIAAAFIACAEQPGETDSRSEGARLTATDDAGTFDPDADSGNDAGTPDADAAYDAGPPPPGCDQQPEGGVPPPKCINYCLPGLKTNPAFDCLVALVGTLTGAPTDDQMASCGCTFAGIGNQTKIGPRRTYSCGGEPPFLVSPVGNGNIGIVAGPEYPSCMFDLRPAEPHVIYDPPSGNACMNCHTDPKNPFIPLAMPAAAPAP